MKILYLADYQNAELLSRRGIRRNRSLGGSQKIERIAATLKRNGHEVEILATGLVAERKLSVHAPFRSAVPATDIPVYYAAVFDAPILNHVSSAAWSVYWIRSHGPWDVVIIYNFGFTQTIVAQAVAGRYGCPLVAEYEDDATISLSGPNRYHNWRGRRRIERLRRHIHGAFLVCPELARQLNTTNVLILPGIVDNTELAGRVASTSKPMLIYSGGLSRLKGVDLLIAALPYVSTSLEVHIFGEGPLKPWLLDHASRQTDHPVYVHGAVPREELESYYRAARVAVNPHRMSRGHRGTLFPFKICEYLSFGLPVVSSDVGSIPKELRIGIRSYEEESPHDLATAIEDVVSHAESWRLNGMRARENVLQAYSVQSVGEKLESLLEHATSPFMGPGDRGRASR